MTQSKSQLLELSDELKKKENEILRLKKKQLEVLRQQKHLEEELPHLYVPMYDWQRKLHESDNRVNLLTAANQIGKSSCLIRRNIANCTEPARWEKFWGPNAKPRQFWYFYPDSITLEREIDTKWVPEWMPRGRFEKDAQYGWKLTKKNGIYSACHFNAGPTIYFQMYSKSVANVQAGSVHEVTCDEEMPLEFYDEIMFRLTATAGIFTSGFTPTLNQLFWKQAMEGKKILPSAMKLQISMYDCLKYEDGSPSRVMTLDKIKLAEEKCKNETERQRRIFGKFVTEEGRTYYAFDYDENVVRPYSIKGWFIYAAVDYGSGSDEGAKNGKKNHPAAIVFIAVRPDYKKGAIFKSWRGDGEKTTAGDVFLKYQELAKGLSITQACYDAAAADFGTIATRNGVGFVRADKSRDAGEDLVNTLFKHKMLDIFDDDPENLKLAGELLTIMVSKQRGDAKRDDDLADSTRYGCKLIPWDLSAVDELVGATEEAEQERKARPLTEEEHQAMQIRMRRGEDVGDTKSSEQEGWGELEDEFDHWNAEYG
jgi:phage terminase large subunit-like protein